jgi:hypothetical protein
MGHAEAIVQIKWRAYRARTEVSPNLLRGGFANEKGDFEKRPDWLLLPWGACGVLFDSLPALNFTHSAGCSSLGDWKGGLGPSQLTW